MMVYLAALHTIVPHGNYNTSPVYLLSRWCNPTSPSLFVFSDKCSPLESSMLTDSTSYWVFFLLSAESESECYVMTNGQSASLSWSKAPIWGLWPGLYYMCDSYGLVLVGHPLWREVGSVLCTCCWPLPAQSFSGPSPLGLETIFYCLTFETSLFVASYDSQGHGGGIRPRLHTGIFTVCFFLLPIK
jgi:hypothetical protein